MTSAELKFDLFLKSYHPSHRFVYKANPGNAGDGVIASATYDFSNEMRLPMFLTGPMSATALILIF